MLKSQHVYIGYFISASLYWIIAVTLGQGEPRLLFFSITALLSLYLVARRPWYYWTRALTSATLFGNTILFSFQAYVFSNYVSIGVYVLGGILLTIAIIGLLSSLTLFLHTVLGTYKGKS